MAGRNGGREGKEGRRGENSEREDRRRSGTKKGGGREGGGHILRQIDKEGRGRDTQMVPREERGWKHLPRKANADCTWSGKRGGRREGGRREGGRGGVSACDACGLAVGVHSNCPCPCGALFLRRLVLPCPPCSSRRPSHRGGKARRCPL